MKNPLHYQITEVDCGPTSLLNGLSYLFEREEILPEIPRGIMLFCLNHYSTESVPKIIGTTHTAMLYLSHWLDDYGKTGRMKIASTYLSGEKVNLGENSEIRAAIDRNGVAIMRVDLEGWQYVLLTGIDGGSAYIFDPYRMPDPFPIPCVKADDMHPFSYNRIVPAEQFERMEILPYSFGPYEQREAVLLFRTDTKLSDDS